LILIFSSLQLSFFASILDILSLNLVMIKCWEMFSALVVCFI
jgi:hypothetical protein